LFEEMNTEAFVPDTAIVEMESGEVPEFSKVAV
jgi:hypothetical protein